MKTLKVTFFLLSLTVLFCCNDKKELPVLFQLPKKLKEVSGITTTDGGKSLWVIEDSGNKNKIYQLNREGDLQHTVTVANATNTDWEDLTTDDQHNIYIGDFGNNDNIRKDLVIYKVNAADLGKEEADASASIHFSYPEQKAFPPKKTELWYDVEGFFFWKDNFYLFTKNRSKGFDGTTFLYRVPNKPGTHNAKLMGSFKTCNIYNHCAITGATISPDGKKVALLSHTKVWLFEDFKNDDFFNGKMTRLELNHMSQKEAITFTDNGTLIIADEKVKKNGGNVYEVSVQTLKSKS
ncbi:hypothetical protein [Flavobacterium cerinum]|uniref:SdiA-regulated family protein n=1 Tax=Flavobacterium cerinum TaxID=2502784 RepID=A0ABY5IM88_9FLAO|nr:hypothetical protein [Flavobacterium cerinum]UUC43951.1 hypothetical protein NOX80_09925 [Flavobacterium cerinum]